MTLINRDLIQDIETAKLRLDGSKISNFIQEMFHATEKYVVENASIQDGDNESRGEEVLSSFRNAWEYSQDNYPGSFDLVYLTEVAGRVEPCLCLPSKTYAEFRSTGATLQNICRAPSDGLRIMTHLNRMIDGEGVKDFHPVEQAIYYYFHLMRIQPFENGNKRTANIVMNTMLGSNGFLPIVTLPTERGTFTDYFAGAIEGFKEVGSTGKHMEKDIYLNPDYSQRQFYEFLARKELTSLRCAENKMSGLHQYTLQLPGGHPGSDYLLKHQIESYFKARGIIGQVRLKEAQKIISVIGDMPLKTLEGILHKSPLARKTKITCQS